MQAILKERVDLIRARDTGSAPMGIGAVRMDYTLASSGICAVTEFSFSAAALLELTGLVA